MDVSDSFVRILCYHEAGHTIVALYQRESIHCVKINSDGNGGALHHVPGAKRHTDQEYEEMGDRLRELGGPPLPALRRILFGLAGAMMAEIRLVGRSHWLGRDLNQMVWLLATTSLDEGQCREHIDTALDEAGRIIDDYWLPTQVLAERLFDARYLDEAEIRSAVRSAGNYGRELLGEETPPGHRGKGLTYSKPLPRDRQRPGHEGLMQRSASPISDLRHRAVHEASHAVAAHHFRLPIVEVTARMDRAETRVKFGRHPGANHLVLLMVGEAIEEALGFSGGSPGDREIATELAHGDQEKVDQAFVKARAFVQNHMGEIEKLAAVLESRGGLSGAEISNILAATPEPRPAMTRERQRQALSVTTTIVGSGRCQLARF